MKKTKQYRAKTLFSGRSLNLEGMYVAVPDKFKNDRIEVLFEEKRMVIENWHKAEAYRRFDDKFGRGTYTLGYFKWNPMDEVKQSFMEDMLR